MKSHAVWQTAEWPVVITFNQPNPFNRLDPEQAADRVDRFAFNPDPSLPGEVILRGLKEGA